MKTTDRAATSGKIVRIAGPVVGVTGLENAKLYDVVHIGELQLVGEIIRLQGEVVTVQVYEETSGLRLGERVTTTGGPLSVQLGPGLLGQVYDGLQRPLNLLAEEGGAWIPRGLRAAPLSEDRRWHFTPTVEAGDRVGPGEVLGTTPETSRLDHRILVPHGAGGRVVEIRAGDFKIVDPVARIETTDGTRELTMVQTWPVRRPRPVGQRIPARDPLITGTRVIDALFPLAKGGSAIIPGGFGTGKTVLQQALSRWSDVDVVVYIGCGERGNEMAEVLEEFPNLDDPHTGEPLMRRTVLIANTSNMPVAAREASIYTGITIAEYYRDMGYDVLLLADSTSRWGEALREISGRLEEMPGEEGYPAYLGTRIAEFYERAGRAVPNGSGDRTGSVSVVGAVSPPGGDFSEPVTQNSMRAAGAFWGLDYDLSRRRHFPAINWSQSYTLYRFERDGSETDDGWDELVRSAQVLLREEADLLEIVQLVGPDAMSETERLVLFAARMIREDFLQQSALHLIDRFCPPEKTRGLLHAIMTFYQMAGKALREEVSLERIAALPEVAEIARAKELELEIAVEVLEGLADRIGQSFRALAEKEAV
ncbi:MAG TPA: V-type ATP synthase subunit A [Anaerolineales bacterium]|nr:V-type ATP synthase subunit A [Anaerolineales bacterium]